VFGSGKQDGSKDTARTSFWGGNGNVLDKDEARRPGGAQHAAQLDGHRAAVNDLRAGSDKPGRHRAG